MGEKMFGSEYLDSWGLLLSLFMFIHRVAVALAGTTYLNSEGELVPVKKATVAGTTSEGMLCDSRMLGWSGGGSGAAAQIPYGIDPGSAPPATKPRPQDEEPKPPKIKVDPLCEKKLTKEEKKKETTTKLVLPPSAPATTIFLIIYY